MSGSLRVAVNSRELWRRPITTKTEAASQVRKVLQSIKDRLGQPGGAKVNEATTRAHFLTPLLGALGYQSIDDIVFEHYLPDGKTFLDYRLVVSGKPRVSVEAKALDVPLTEKDAAQVVSYAAILGDEWAVLTNARQWQLFHAFAPAALADKRMLTIDLIGWNSDAEFDAVFEQLWLVSQDAFESGDGPASWVTTKKLDQWLKSRLSDPASPEVKYLRKQAEAAGLKATGEQIATWLKARVDGARGIDSYPTKDHVSQAPHEAPLSAIAATSNDYVAPDPSPGTSPTYWLIPAGAQGGFSSVDHLTAWLNKGFWGFGQKTAGRKSMKVGDWAAFYAAKSGCVMAFGRIAGSLDTLVDANEWPGPNPQTEQIYKVPLSDLKWLAEPVWYR